MTETHQRYDRVVAWAREAGQLTLRWFEPGAAAVDRKADRTPVTDADRQAELWLRQRIADEYPEDGIVGEEFGTVEGTSPFRWILDPIDGTKSFICGVPLFGTMVGLERDGDCIAGAVHIPALDEGIHAAVGQGAWWYARDREPRRAQVAARQHLRDAVLVTSEVASFVDRAARAEHQRRATMESEPASGSIDAAAASGMQLFHRLQSSCYFARTWGDCYGYLLVATGRADVMIDPVLSIWDAAAVAPIIREAGGVFCDWQGKERIDAGEGLGTYQPLLDQVLAFLR